MILSYQTLLARLGELIPMENERDPALVNPASIDIRVGKDLMPPGSAWTTDLSCYTAQKPFLVGPGEFFLVSTLETLAVPVDLAMELRLKSSRAREGWNHSLAFWFDPGWWGVGTLELSNLSKNLLPIYYGMKIAQLIFHRLDQPCAKPYVGKYQNATAVESSKP